MMKRQRRIEYCDVCDTFKEWLVENGHRFHRNYKIRHYAKSKTLRIYFEDVTQELSCYVSQGGIGTSVHFKGICWDIVKDFDFFIKRGRNSKYYCELCKERKYYDTPQELLIDHSFENFLEWINNHFTQHHLLELSQCEGMTRAKIIDTRELYSDHEHERKEFKSFLLGLRKLGPGYPLAFENLEKMKFTFIPVIKTTDMSSFQREID